VKLNGGDGGESGAALGIATSKDAGQWASFASETWWAPQMVGTWWQRQKTETGSEIKSKL